MYLFSFIMHRPLSLAFMFDQTDQEAKHEVTLGVSIPINTEKVFSLRHIL